MPSKKMEEFLKTASPETISQIKEQGKTLQSQGVEEKPMNYDAQAPPRMGQARPNAAEPKLNENLLSAQDRPQNAVDRYKAQTATPKQESPSQQKETDLER